MLFHEAHGITVPQGYFELVQALEKSQAIFSFRGLKVVQPRPEAEARHSDQEMEEPEIFSRPGQAQNSPTDTFFLWMGLRPTINPTTQIICAQTLIKHKYVQHFYPSFNSSVVECWLHKPTVPGSNPGIDITISKFHPNLFIIED